MCMLVNFSEALFPRQRRTFLLTFILIGVIYSMFVSSAMSILVTFASDKLKSITFWTMGSFQGSTYGNAALLADGGPGITVRAGAEPLQPGDIPRGGGTAEGASCPESPEPRGSAPEGREAPQCRDNAGEGLPDGGRSC